MKLFRIKTNVEEVIVAGAEEYDARDKALEKMKEKHFSQQVFVEKAEQIADTISHRSYPLYIP